MTKEELLQGVMKYLAEHGVANATFRALAAHLGISTYPLLYYFGSKNELLSAVVAEVERRQREFSDRALQEGGSLVYWQWCAENPELLRLDLEILLHETRETDARPLADLVFRDWHRLWMKRLMDSGISREEAETAVTLSVAVAVGLQMDLVATGDIERTTRAFKVQHDEFYRKLGSGLSSR